MNNIERINRPSVMLASTIFVGVGFLVYNLLPIILKSATDSLGLTEQQLGYLGSSYMAGSAVSNILAIFWVRKVNWRLAVLVGSLIAGVSFALASLSDYGGLLALFFAIGFATSVFISCIYTCMGDTENPNRAFGYGIGVQVVLAGASAFLLPVLVIPEWGFPGVMLFLAGMSLVILPLTFLIPPRGVVTEAIPSTPSITSTPKDGARTITHGSSVTLMRWGFLGLFIYFVGQSGIWAFFGRIGGDAGLSDHQLGSIFGATLILSAVGGFMSGWFSVRYDRRWLIAGSIAIGIVSMVLLIMPLQMGYWLFATAVLIYSISWNFVMPFLITIIVECDEAGNFTPLVPACQLFGSVVGPAAAGNMIVGGSYLYVCLFAILSVILCTLIFIGIDTLGLRNKAACEIGVTADRTSGAMGGT